MRFAGVRFVVSLLVLHGFAASQESRPTPAQQALGDLVREELAKQQIPGAAIAAACDGSVLFAEGIGQADLENRVPVTEGSRFRIASISKCLTAVGAMKLVERGRLDLAGDVRSLVPEFPEKTAVITPRHLLAHLSGIRHYRPGEIDSTVHYDHLIDALAPFKDDALLFEPGLRHGYTTYGYTLLGCVIERAAGEAFAAYLKREVLDPAGMTATEPDDARRIIARRVRGYVLAGGAGLQNCHLADTSVKVPGGGMLSTASDLVSFGLALMAGRLVRPETLGQMTTPQRTNDGKETGYGLGFGVSRSKGRTYVSHTGGQQGASTVICFVPERQAAIALLTNLEGVKDIGPLGRRLMDRLLEILPPK